MAQLNVRLSVFGLSLLAATSILSSSAIPAAASAPSHTVRLMSPARTVVALPMLCPEPKDSSTVQVMIDIDSTYARKSANWDAPAVGRLVKYQCFDVAGRNKNAEWLLIPYGTSQAWIHGSMVRFRGDLLSLPLTEDVTTKTTLSTALPRGLPYIGYRSRSLYLKSVRLGHSASMFTVIGDCNSEPAVYLGRFAAGGFDASTYPSLKSTVPYFAPSYTRASIATHGSFNAGMAFDATWSNPNVCNADEGPLACELRVSQASILVIALGTGDQHTWADFEGHYRAILDYTLQAGVLPVLMTKADALESQEGSAPEGYINDVIRKLGREYAVPVIDFWLATRSLPNNGLAEERNSALQLTNAFHLSEEGMDMRMLMTLLTLKSISYR